MGPYVLATQQKWGEEVYDLVSKGRTGEPWVLLKGESKSLTEVLLKQLVGDLRPRYVFFVHWSVIVPAVVLDRVECVNFHCTDLPYGRGGHPIENLLLAGKTETVMTAHRMTRGIDEGPVYAKYPGVPLAGRKPEILAGFVVPVAQMIRYLVEDEPVPTAQEGHVVRFSRLSKEAYAEFWRKRGGVAG